MSGTLEQMHKEVEKAVANIPVRDADEALALSCLLLTFSISLMETCVGTERTLKVLTGRSSSLLDKLGNVPPEETIN